MKTSKRIQIFSKSLIVAFFLHVTFTMSAQVEWISTTDRNPWVKTEIRLIKKSKSTVDATIIPEIKEQVVDGFGACFNELGWTALSVLNESERETILKNLFDPGEGLKLNICRMPVGANDYARDYYSLNDSVDDFDMRYFFM